MNIQIGVGKRVYFFSDAHLGSPDHASSLERERRLVSCLEGIRGDAEALFLLGDIFDFWFEYRQVVPRGFVRLLGKLSEFSDAGIPVFYFPGNHDMWMYGYLEQEVGMRIIEDPVTLEINGKRFFLGHGDGLGPGDYSYKMTKRLFRSSVARWFFARLHPNFGVSLARWLSRTSRNQNGHKDTQYLGEEKEYLISFAKEYEKEHEVDFFIFGHRHFPMRLELPGRATYINLGDWIQHYSYASFDGNGAELHKYGVEEGMRSSGDTFDQVK